MCVKVCVKKSGSLDLFEQKRTHRKGKQVISFQTWCLGRSSVVVVCGVWWGSICMCVCVWAGEHKRVVTITLYIDYTDLKKGGNTSFNETVQWNCIIWCAEHQRPGLTNTTCKWRLDTDGVISHKWLLFSCVQMCHLAWKGNYFIFQIPVCMFSKIRHWFQLINVNT